MTFKLNIIYRAFVAMTTTGTPEYLALSDRAYLALRSQIADMTLRPGEHLHLSSLAKSLGLSNTPVREALNRLSSEGLVVTAAYRGFSVAPLLSYDELGQLLEVRSAIEISAVAGLGVDTDEASILEVRNQADKVAALSAADSLDIVSFNNADRDFHAALIDLSGNPFYSIAYQSLNIHTQVLRYYRSSSLPDAHMACAEHAAIVDALEARDVERAKTTIVTHIRNVRKRIVEGIGE